MQMKEVLSSSLQVHEIVHNTWNDSQNHTEEALLWEVVGIVFCIYSVEKKHQQGCASFTATTKKKI